MTVDGSVVALVAIGLLFALLVLGVHIGIALTLSGIVAMTLKLGFTGALSILARGPFTWLDEYTWTTMPLFTLMGLMAFYSGMSAKLFVAAQAWLGGRRGGLLLATTLAAGAFAGATGSSVASTAVFTKIALPEMLERGYDKGLSAGCIAACGTLAIMIPPSGLMVVYGMFTMTSIAKLLIGGIIPGFLILALYMLMVWLRCSLKPTLAPRQEVSYSLKEKLGSLAGCWGLPIVFIAVMGGMFIGIFTATQAGAVGALVSIIVALFYRGLTRQHFLAGLVETGKVTAMIFLIIVGALVFSRAIALSQLPTAAVQYIRDAGFATWIVLGGFMLIYLILGCFVEGIALLAITLPIMFPVVLGLRLDPVWFGIINVMVVEIALITPPVGLTVFVVKGIAGDSIALPEIFRGVGSFVIADIIALALLLAFPQIVLWLPGLMLGK